MEQLHDGRNLEVRRLNVHLNEKMLFTDFLNICQTMYKFIDTSSVYIITESYERRFSEITWVNNVKPHCELNLRSLEEFLEAAEIRPAIRRDGSLECPVSDANLEATSHLISRLLLSGFLEKLTSSQRGTHDDCQVSFLVPTSSSSQARPPLCSSHVD